VHVSLYPVTVKWNVQNKGLNMFNLHKITPSNYYSNVVPKLVPLEIGNLLQREDEYLALSLQNCGKNL